MPGEYPDAIDQLIESLGELPGIGRRSAERLAMALLEWDPPRLKQLGERIATLPERVHQCCICGNLADADECRICRNPRRDHSVICVVEQARQIPVIEKSGRFDGLYHVLGGRLSPLAQVDYEDLNVESLYRRVAAGDVREVIISTSPDVEGEATASCLAAELRERFDLEVSRLAQGLPVGADLSYADGPTIAMALDARRKL